MKREGYLTKREIIKIFGDRCEENEPGCIVCAAWLEYDMLMVIKFRHQDLRKVFKKLGGK